MNFQIAMLLGQDGMTNGAIYALLALSILLVFTVTRILLIPQGEFVTYGALTMATLQSGHPTALVWLLLGLTLIDCALDLWGAARSSQAFRFPVRILFKLGYAGLLAVLINTLPLAELPMAVQALLTLALVVPLGPQIYRLVFQPIASASSLGSAESFHRAVGVVRAAVSSGPSVYSMVIAISFLNGGGVSSMRPVTNWTPIWFVLSRICQNKSSDNLTGWELGKRSWPPTGGAWS